MLIQPGYWPDTYWPDRYWPANYWPAYGAVVVPEGRARPEPPWWPAYEELIRRLWEEDDEILVLT